MKIVILRDCFAGGKPLEAGKQADIPDDQAKRLMAMGSAKLVKVKK